MIGGGEGNSLGLRKSSTRMVALIITSFKGWIGSSNKCLSDIGIFFHLADSSIDCARRRGKDLEKSIIRKNDRWRQGEKEGQRQVEPRRDIVRKREIDR